MSMAKRNEGGEKPAGYREEKCVTGNLQLTNSTLKTGIAGTTETLSYFYRRSRLICTLYRAL